MPRSDSYAPPIVRYPSIQISRSEPGTARAEHTELVALGISENDRRLIALAYVSTRRSEHKETIDFSVSIIWPEVEVNPVLHRLWLGHRDEEEAGQSIRSRSNLELVWFVVHDNPSQRLPPQRPSVPGLRASTIVWSHSRLTGRSSELRRRAELLRQRQPLALASDERVHEQP